MSRDLSRGLIDLVELIPFDVQFALTVDLEISIFQVLDVVEVWLGNSFTDLLIQEGYTQDLQYATFDRVILDERNARWLLQQQHKEQLRRRRRHLENNNEEDEEDDDTGVLYTARIQGHALFVGEEDNLDQQSLKVPVGEILEMQRSTLQDNDKILQLKEALQDADPDGLGQALVDCNAYLNPYKEQPASNNSSDEQLQLVIIIAVAVACIAFLFLILAVLWAWRYDRRNRRAYLVQGGGKERPTGSSETTDDDNKTPSPVAAPPLQAIYPNHDDGDGLYPDSVITEDISSSLNQYYKSGLAQSNPYLKQAKMNDAASVSSMESYGYSLDGYAPTIATPMPSDLQREDNNGAGQK